MEQQLKLWPRDFGENFTGEIELAVTPRVILCFNNEVLLVPWKTTGWYGLPGGHVTENEFLPEVNLINPSDAFPTLQREVFEEAGVDISELKQEMKFLGLCEIYGVNSVNKTAVQYHSPIFFNMMTEEIYNQAKEIDRNLLLDLSNPGAVPLFPDASLSIDLLKRRYQPPGGFLGEESYLYFQTKPVPQLLLEPPQWLRNITEAQQVETYWE